MLFAGRGRHKSINMNTAIHICIGQYSRKKNNGKGVKTMLEEYVTAVTLAKSLGISRVGLYNMVKRGELPAGVKIGKSRRWRVSLVNEFLNKKIR